MGAIPTEFEEWKHCIEVKCGIPLTQDFAEQRLTLLEQAEIEETQRFVALYGQEHLSNIKNWFKRVIEELKTQSI